MFLKNLFINWLKPFIKIIKSELSKINSPILGDIKTGIQNADHNGWIILDGRAKVTLNQKQQSNATALGIGANIPNATDCQLTQNGTALGSVSGSNTKNIAQNQLPNITLSGTTSSNGNHKHWIDPPATNSSWSGSHNHNIPISFSATMFSWGIGGGVAGFTQAGGSNTSDIGNHQHTIDIPGFDSSDNGSHIHNVTTNSINGNVTQQSFDIRGKQLSINAFIFLGI